MFRFNRKGWSIDRLNGRVPHGERMFEVPSCTPAALHHKMHQADGRRSTKKSRPGIHSMSVRGTWRAMLILSRRPVPAGSQCKVSEGTGGDVLASILQTQPTRHFLSRDQQLLTVDIRSCTDGSVLCSAEELGSRGLGLSKTQLAHPTRELTSVQTV